jgi:outer membrane protein OmpA-like peptidoglycan-associated protein
VGRLVSTATTVPVAPAPIAFRVAPAPGATAGKPNPLFGPAYDPNDGKPVITCASDPYVSHLTLLQIQAQGLDVKNGFHLGIIPLGLNTVYDLEVDDYAGRVRRGEWDCVLDRVDENAELDIGVITTLTDESAGSNGIWAREITSTYGLAGKRIGYVTNTSSRFFALYATAILPVEQQRTVTLVPFDSPSRAMEGFARNEVDAVSAWQPFLAESEATGGRPVVTTGQLRVIANAIIMSRKSVTERPEAVQAFHRAWYEAVRDQLDKPKEASAAIAAWGSPEWTRVTPDNALSYLRTEYAQVAQATFAQNIALMANPKSLIAQMELSRRVRTLAGSTDVSTVPVKDQIDTRFVQHLANEAGLKSRSAPVNGSFSLAASAVVVGSEASFAELPCTEFTFRPNSVELTPDSIRVLDICVVPAMEQRPTVQLKIVGSSAWPKGSAFSAAEVEQFGLLRARAIASYLIARGIDTSRLQVSGALPPPERREIDDSVLLQRDRNVRMTLLFGGW